MPVSANQKTLACIALSIRRGKTKASYSKQATGMAKSMSESKLAEWCGGEIKKE